MLSKYLIFRFWKPIIVSLGILYLSFAPPSTFNGIPSFNNEDKLVHFLLYSGLTCLLIYDFNKNRKANKVAFILVCIAFPIVLGGAVEILQPMYFAPRTAEWFDWFSDIAGVLVGWLSMQFLKKWKILT